MKFITRLCTIAVAAATLLAGAARAQAQTTEGIRTLLFGIEAESHQQWLQGDVAALGELMADEFHFVVMNGAVETRAEVVGAPYTGAGPLRVRSLHVEPETFALRGDVAIVISLLHIDASVREQRLAPRMRILSIFTRDESAPDWKLTARSITPILTPPGRDR
jgi:ketosteroid isomerase-like protein